MPNTLAPAAPREVSLATKLRQYYALTKPRVVQLIVFCALIGMLLATPGLPDWRLVLAGVAGIWLVAGEIPMYRRHKRCLTRSGDVVWVRSTVSLLRDAANEPWRIVGVVEDITEHLRLEEAERAREAAELSNRAKSDFLSRMPISAQKTMSWTTRGLVSA